MKDIRIDSGKFRTHLRKGQGHIILCKINFCLEHDRQTSKNMAFRQAVRTVGNRLSGLNTETQFVRLYTPSAAPQIQKQTSEGELPHLH